MKKLINSFTGLLFLVLIALASYSNNKSKDHKPDNTSNSIELIQKGAN